MSRFLQFGTAFALAAVCEAQTHVAQRLRVEYLDNPLSIDIPDPAFSWAVSHPNRSEYQTAYRLVVTQTAPAVAPAWDSGWVGSNRTVNVPYAGAPLQPDSDYSWVVQWRDSSGVASLNASSTFSTALFAESQWYGAQWISSTSNSSNSSTAGDGGLNVYRSTAFNITGGGVTRARLYIAGLGYYKAWLNGVRVDGIDTSNPYSANSANSGSSSDSTSGSSSGHNGGAGGGGGGGGAALELGAFNEYPSRILYSAIDVTNLVNAASSSSSSSSSSGSSSSGCNVLGVMLGHGWYDRAPVMNHTGNRQFRAILSVTTTAAAGSVATQFFISALRPGSGSGSGSGSSSSSKSGDVPVTPLYFQAAAGPVVSDDLFNGETFDARIAAALGGPVLLGSGTAWATCGYNPATLPNGTSVQWHHAVAPAKGPVNYGAVMTADRMPITTDATQGAVRAVSITEPVPGQWVFSYPRNMAAIATLSLPLAGCAAGTVITLVHGEILYPNGSVHNHYGSAAEQTVTYVCAGVAEQERYRYLFTQAGFQHVQLTGFPGTPTADTLVAHVLHSNLSATRSSFASSSPLLNSIQAATTTSLLSNLISIPTSCPQRERLGWFADAATAFDAVMHNFGGDVAPLYVRWLTLDVPDLQQWNAALDGGSGAITNYVPFPLNFTYHLNADAGWGYSYIALTSWLSQYYDDEQRVLSAVYPALSRYLRLWIALATTAPGATGFLPANLTYWGDWQAYWPGTAEGWRGADYGPYFYCKGLQTGVQIATTLGLSGDAQAFSDALQAATQLYLQTFYNASTGCFGNCSYLSQIFGLSLGVLPRGSAAEAAAWAHTVAWFAGPTAPFPDHFPGGIWSLNLLYTDLLDRFGGGWPGHGLMWHTQPDLPSIGYWAHEGFTALPECYNMTLTNPGSYGVASYNHAMFAGAGSWYYRTLVGIRRVPGSKGWGQLQLSPPGPDTGILQQLAWAAASIDTPIGVISLSWALPSQQPLPQPPAAQQVVQQAVQQQQEVYSLNATIPCNAAATITIPVIQPCVSVTITDTLSGGDSGAGSVGGSVVWRQGVFVPGTPGITSGACGADGATVILQAGSGSYAFVVTSA